MRLAESGIFDLITLDVDLPGASGFEICTRLKENPRLRDTRTAFASDVASRGRPATRF